MLSVDVEITVRIVQKQFAANMVTLNNRGLQNAVMHEQIKPWPTVSKPLEFMAISLD